MLVIPSTWASCADRARVLCQPCMLTSVCRPVPKCSGPIIDSRLSPKRHPGASRACSPLLWTGRVSQVGRRWPVLQWGFVQVPLIRRIFLDCTFLEHIDHCFFTCGKDLQRCSVCLPILVVPCLRDEACDVSCIGFVLVFMDQVQVNGQLFSEKYQGIHHSDVFIHNAYDVRPVNSLTGLVPTDRCSPDTVSLDRDICFAGHTRTHPTSIRRLPSAGTSPRKRP